MKFTRIKALDHLSLLKKMMVIFIVCVILPVSIQNIFYYSDTEYNLKEQVMQKLESRLNERTATLNGSLSGALQLSMHINTNEVLYQFLDRRYKNDYEYFINYQDQLIAYQLLDATYQQINSVTIYTDNPTVFNGATVRSLMPWDTATLGESLIESTVSYLGSENMGAQLRLTRVPQRLNTNYDRALAIVRPLNYYPRYNTYNKMIRIELNLKYISSMLLSSDLFDNMLLLDAGGRVLASASGYSETGAFQIFHETDLPDDYTALRRQIGDLPLWVCGLYDTSGISSEFTQLRLRTLSVAFCGVLLALIGLAFISINMNQRMQLVVEQSKRIARGDFRHVENIGSDEIGTLGVQMNSMADQLRDLIEVEYESRLRGTRLEREKVRAQLLALQSQVDPHFMFNALEAIRLKAMVKGEIETAAMIKYMSRMFRHTIDWDEDVVPLSDEIRFLGEYLKIQKYRFDDEFEYTLNISDDAAKCMLPKLMIQPLVENACVHGARKLGGIGRVEITARLLIDTLRITVTDNGDGIDEIRLNELRHMFAGGEKPAGSVGLYNVYQRLKLYYGEAFVLDVSSRQGCGTCFTLEIPGAHAKEELYVPGNVD